jgi:isoleucyl-tRNA synthetase
MYQNLRTANDPQSVHLCDYPVVDEKLIDELLSQDMEALLRLVSLGSAARNASKIKVRQPLAELRVQPGDDPAEDRALDRFGDQLGDELNLKCVREHNKELGDLLKAEAKANMKTLGPKAGARLQEVKKAIEAADASNLEADLKNGPVELNLPGGPFTIEAADVTIQYKGPEGWSGVADGKTQVLLDTRITPALAREGTARDVVRQVQESRKNAGLEMEDRIELHLATGSDKLREAITAQRDYIAAETLTDRWATAPLNGEAYRTTVKVDGQALVIELRRV